MQSLLVNPAFIVPVAIVAASAIFGWGDPLVLAVVVAMITAARLLTRGRLDHGVERAVAAIGHALGAAIFAVIFVVAFVPAHAIGRRRWTRDRRGAPAWTTRRTPTVGGEHHLSTGADATTQGAPHLLLRSIGLVTVILVGNYAIGAAWDSLSPRAPAPADTSSPTQTNVSGSEAPPDGSPEEAAATTDDDTTWWDLYQEHNAVQRLVDTVRDELDGDPAGAEHAH